MAADIIATENASRDLLNYVVELLQYLDFPRTCEALAEERKEKRAALSTSINTRGVNKDSRERLRVEMLRKFDEGKRDDFFLAWAQYVPAAQLGYDYATQKFEFYLQVYFAIYPVLPSSCVLVVTPGGHPGLSGQAGVARSGLQRHELQQRMKAFKLFLETRGAALAHTPEFLQYYALPYVPQPEHHPSFESLFNANWVADQRLKLKQFLESISHKNQDLPKLYLMYDEYMKAEEHAPRLSPHHKHLIRMSSRGASRDNPLLSREGGQRSPGASLLGRTGGGLEPRNSAPQPGGARASRGGMPPLPPRTGSAAQLRQANSVGEHPPNGGRKQGGGDDNGIASDDDGSSSSLDGLSDVLSNTQRSSARKGSAKGKGPRQRGDGGDGMSASVVSLSQLGGGGGVLRTSLTFLEETYAQEEGSAGGGSGLLAPLAYGRLKRDLVGPDHRLASRLLQALCWRLTRCRPGTDRWNLIASWIEADLLECHSPTVGGSIIKKLAALDDPFIHSELGRLVNALASDRLGRNYLLLPAGDTIPSLMAILRRYSAADPTAAVASMAAAGGEGAAGPADQAPPYRDGTALQQALVALQKLSLKRVAQSQMIAMGTIQWVVDTLQDLNTVSEFVVEYGVALMMNLCLRSAGRATAASPELVAALLRLCENLLEHPNEQIRTYVHGTLYSIFSRRAVREAARVRGTQDLLAAVMETAPPVFASQLEHIIKRLTDAPEVRAQQQQQEGGADPHDAAGPPHDHEDDDAATLSADEAGRDGDVDIDDEEADAYADVELSPEVLPHPEAGEAAGEELLCAAYLADTAEAQAHAHSVRATEAAVAAAHQLATEAWGEETPEGAQGTGGSVGAEEPTLHPQAAAGLLAGGRGGDALDDSICLSGSLAASMRMSKQFAAASALALQESGAGGGEGEDEGADPAAWLPPPAPGFSRPTTGAAAAAPGGGFGSRATPRGSVAPEMISSGTSIVAAANALRQAGTGSRPGSSAGLSSTKRREYVPPGGAAGRPLSRPTTPSVLSTSQRLRESMMLRSSQQQQNWLHGRIREDEHEGQDVDDAATAGGPSGAPHNHQRQQHAFDRLQEQDEHDDVHMRDEPLRGSTAGSVGGRSHRVSSTSGGGGGGALTAAPPPVPFGHMPGSMRRRKEMSETGTGPASATQPTSPAHSRPTSALTAGVQPGLAPGASHGSPLVRRSNSSSGLASLSLTAAAAQARAAAASASAAASPSASHSGPLLPQPPPPRSSVGGVRLSIEGRGSAAGSSANSPSAASAGQAAGSPAFNGPPARVATPVSPNTALQQRAERDVQKLRTRMGPAPAAAAPGASQEAVLMQEYLSAFGGKRELPRTPAGVQK